MKKLIPRNILEPDAPSHVASSSDAGADVPALEERELSDTEFSRSEMQMQAFNQL